LNSQVSADDNILAYLLFKPYTEIWAAKATPISMDFFTIFAVLFGYCVVICGAMFFAEKLTVISLIEMYFRWRNRIMRVWFYRKFGFPLSYVP